MGSGSVASNPITRQSPTGHPGLPTHPITQSPNPLRGGDGFGSLTRSSLRGSITQRAQGSPSPQSRKHLTRGVTCFGGATTASCEHMVTAPQELTPRSHVRPLVAHRGQSHDMGDPSGNLALGHRVTHPVYCTQEDSEARP